MSLLSHGVENLRKTLSELRLQLANRRRRPKRTKQLAPCHVNFPVEHLGDPLKGRVWISGRYRCIRKHLGVLVGLTHFLHSREEKEIWIVASAALVDRRLFSQL